MPFPLEPFSRDLVAMDGYERAIIDGDFLGDNALRVVLCGLVSEAGSSEMKG